MASIGSHRAARPSFAQRLVAALAAADQFASWWGAHRAWPANEPARVQDRCD